MSKCTYCSGNGKVGNYMCTHCNGTGSSQVQSWKKHDDGCFSSSTLILTPSGWKKINEVCKGDLVLSLDSRNDAFVSARVKSRQVHNSVRIYELHIDGAAIETTKYHPFYTDRGWVQAKDLDNNDQLLSITGNFIPIRNLVTKNQYETVYNLVVEEFYNYIVTGNIIANSFSHFWNVRTLLNRTLDNTRNLILNPVSNSL